MKILDPVSHKIRKETILQHARHLFATKGFAETSMEDIARTCHMQKASLYHYFTSKQQLLQELVDMEGTRRTQRIQELSTGKDLRETLRLIAGAFLNDLNDPSRREFLQITYFESHKNPCILKALKESPSYNRKGFHAIFAKHLEGKLPHPEIAMVVTQFMGALIHYATLVKLRGENMCFEPFDETLFVTRLVNTFVKGIA